MNRCTCCRLWVCQRRALVNPGPVLVSVTNATDRTMELRALMSAADASTAWTLRCEVREKLVEFIKTEYPQALPRMRAELHRLEDIPNSQKNSNPSN